MSPATTRHHDMPRLGPRSTRQRTAVYSVLQELSSFISAKDLHHELSERHLSVGLTTVYRTLQSLADVGAVDVLHMATGESLYRSCESDAHHHHLVCTGCGRTEEIDGGPVEDWARTVANSHGYQLTGHEAEIFGLCEGCKDDER